MTLADDISAKIRTDFLGGEMLPVIEMLTELQAEDLQLFCDRILRCIVYIADGEFDELAGAVKLARLDFRRPLWVKAKGFVLALCVVNYPTLSPHLFPKDRKRERGPMIVDRDLRIRQVTKRILGHRDVF